MPGGGAPVGPAGPSSADTAWRSAAPLAPLTALADGTVEFRRSLATRADPSTIRPLAHAGSLAAGPADGQLVARQPGRQAAGEDGPAVAPSVRAAGSPRPTGQGELLPPGDDAGLAPLPGEPVTGATGATPDGPGDAAAGDAAAGVARFLAGPSASASADLVQRVAVSDPAGGARPLTSDPRRRLTAAVAPLLTPLPAPAAVPVRRQTGGPAPVMRHPGSASSLPAGDGPAAASPLADPSAVRLPDRAAGTIAELAHSPAADRPPLAPPAVPGPDGAAADSPLPTMASDTGPLSPAAPDRGQRRPGWLDRLGPIARLDRTERAGPSPAPAIDHPTGAGAPATTDRPGIAARADADADGPLSQPAIRPADGRPIPSVPGAPMPAALGLPAAAALPGIAGGLASLDAIDRSLAPDAVTAPGGGPDLLPIAGLQPIARPEEERTPVASALGSDGAVPTAAGAAPAAAPGGPMGTGEAARSTADPGSGGVARPPTAPVVAPIGRVPTVGPVAPSPPARLDRRPAPPPTSTFRAAGPSPVADRDPAPGPTPMSAPATDAQGAGLSPASSSAVDDHAARLDTARRPAAYDQADRLDTAAALVLGLRPAVGEPAAGPVAAHPTSYSARDAGDPAMDRAGAGVGLSVARSAALGPPPAARSDGVDAGGWWPGEPTRPVVRPGRIPAPVGPSAGERAGGAPVSMPAPPTGQGLPVGLGPRLARSEQVDREPAPEAPGPMASSETMGMAWNPSAAQPDHAPGAHPPVTPGDGGAPSWPSGAGAPDGTSNVSPGAAGGAGPADNWMELTDEIYRRVARRLRTELHLDRERTGEMGGWSW